MTRQVSKIIQFGSMKQEANGVISGASGDWVGIGSTAMNAEFDDGARMMIVQNLTDVDIFYTFDPDNDALPASTQFMLPSNGQLVLDLTSNATHNDEFLARKGSVLYARGAPTSGTVYCSIVYGYVNS